MEYVKYASPYMEYRDLDIEDIQGIMIEYINEKIKDVDFSHFVTIYQDYTIPAGVLTTDECPVDKASMEILIKQLILDLIFEDQYKDCNGTDTYLEFPDLEGLFINRTGNVISIYYGYLYDWEFSIAPEDVLCDFIEE